MCGIAGYSLNRKSSIDRTLTAQALLAEIAERGADAVGYAYRGPGLGLQISKQRSGASQLLGSVSVPADASQVLVHVRDYTKGHPSLTANNHPIRHGAVVGIHNGIIENDEELFAKRGFARAEPDMTVDSEVIFALMEAERNRALPLEELYGAMAAAWVDERVPDVLFLARGVGRPLWIGEGPNEILFVVDSMIGQDAVTTAKAFHDRLDFDGVILTKLDGDTRGGAALSIRSVVNKPIKFVGIGEKLGEFYWGPLVGGGIETWLAYVIALLFLLYRPQGLFGEKIIERI